MFSSLPAVGGLEELLLELEEPEVAPGLEPVALGLGLGLALEPLAVDPPAPVEPLPAAPGNG